MYYVYLVIIFVITFIIALFVQLNNYPVTIHYFFGTKDMNLALVLFLSFVIGFLIAVIARIPQDINNKRRFRSLERELAEKENRLKVLSSVQPVQPQQEQKPPEG
ncbi:MAG: LapA family protein [bacterium]